jgi:hypothetical protein
VQTFLPYAGFADSARVLDTPRLGKQRVEAFQVLRALTVPGYGWQNHPAVRMWRGHQEALVTYGVVITEEWLRRGHADTCLAKISELSPGGAVIGEDEAFAGGLVPPWVGDEAFHLSHQSSLLRKDPEHYRPYFPDVPDDLPYVWPVPKPAPDA